MRFSCHNVRVPPLCLRGETRSIRVKRGHAHDTTQSSHSVRVLPSGRCTVVSGLSRNAFLKRALPACAWLECFVSELINGLSKMRPNQRMPAFRMSGYELKLKIKSLEPPWPPSVAQVVARFAYEKDRFWSRTMNARHGFQRGRGLDVVFKTLEVWTSLEYGAGTAVRNRDLIENDLHRLALSISRDATPTSSRALRALPRLPDSISRGQVNQGEPDLLFFVAWVAHRGLAPH